MNTQLSHLTVLEHIRGGIKSGTAVEILITPLAARSKSANLKNGDGDGNAVGIGNKAHVDQVRFQSQQFLVALGLPPPQNDDDLPPTKLPRIIIWTRQILGIQRVISRAVQLFPTEKKGFERSIDEHLWNSDKEIEAGQ